MARAARVNVAGGWYHVMNRGLDGMTVFEELREHEHFLELVGEMVERYGVEVHAYALMGNHYHLLIRTPGANASSAIQWLNVSYSVWYNIRRQRHGPVFQGRFKSVLIEGDGSWLLDASVYVHLNPIRIWKLDLGKMQNLEEAVGVRVPTRKQVLARLKELRVYRWNSFRAYAGYVSAPDWLSVKELLCRGGGKVAYRKYVQGYVTRGQDVEALEERLLLGTEQFRAKVRGLAGTLSKEQPARRELVERVSLDKIKAVVSREWKEPWEAFVDRHGDRGRDVGLYVARKRSGLTLQQIGEGLCGIDSRAAGQAVRQVQRRMLTDEALNRKISKCLSHL
jgi:putative transposase